MRKGFTSLSSIYAKISEALEKELLDEDSFHARRVQRAMLAPREVTMTTSARNMEKARNFRKNYGSVITLVVVDEAMTFGYVEIDGHKVPLQRTSDGTFAFTPPTYGVSRITIRMNEVQHAPNNRQQRRRQAHEHGRQRDCCTPREPQSWRHATERPQADGERTRFWRDRPSR